MKTKIILIVLSSILIGFAAGFFISGRLLHKKVEQIKAQQNSRHLEERIIKDLMLTEEQKVVVLPIIQKFAHESDEARRAFRKSSREMKRNFVEALKPHLNPEQIERFQRRMKRKKKGKRSFRPELME